MAQAQYLQIIFEFEGPPKTKEIQALFDKAIDWVRIAPNVWILWTTTSQGDWYKRIKPLLGENEHVYIFGINNNVRHGWAPKWIWEWLDSDHKEH